ncbi:hypothetical protein EFV37_25095 [Mesorhizobium loti]|uniref:Uncharacterized protein n=1 Tax=Mesorhizobium jarvisii TaxID=1777867 RepID=A0A6M7TM43_9HYPH|nr:MULTISPECIES: hypothetical protein [Mesorhizobium]OBQ68401.1 hypothetical protein A9K72_09120 [Mesorhizobium loti]QKC65178.1 hypothetical protein EB229_25090 [Mesorhizobium jarvisii]QKD11093.1 hypothetical protein EFV37_25095 [Mesorhizobium loti]RJT31101.1 hypothetical protein D3242_22845 [Mesorhizobium jarvisii]
MRRYKLSITTDAGGAATAYSPRIAGKIHSIQYVKTDFANGVGFTVTAEATGESIWSEAAVNASAVRYPRAPTHTQAGAAALYAAGGVAVQDKIGLASDRVKVVIASGGATKTGTIHILVD